MNSLTICGNLGKDAEIRYLPNGDPVASFSIADSQGKDKSSLWWNCSIFGKRAESLAPYLLKGQTVTVIGSVSERPWTDKQGVERKNMDVRVSEIALQGGRKDDGAAKPTTTQASRTVTSKSAPSFSDMDEDLPFAPPPRKSLTSI